MRQGRLDGVIDGKWIAETLERVAVGFSKKHSVPIHLNQWGVKDEVFDANGRRRYAQAMLDALHAHSTSSTYWLWREKHKPHRDVNEDGVWGFELARNDGPHEALDGKMLATLQAGFARTALQRTGQPCAVRCGGCDREDRASTSERRRASRVEEARSRRDTKAYDTCRRPCHPQALSAIRTGSRRASTGRQSTNSRRMLPFAQCNSHRRRPGQPLPSDASMMLAAIAVVGVMLFLIALATAFLPPAAAAYSR